MVRNLHQVGFQQCCETEVKNRSLPHLLARYVHFQTGKQASYSQNTANGLSEAHGPSPIACCFKEKPESRMPTHIRLDSCGRGLCPCQTSPLKMQSGQTPHPLQYISADKYISRKLQSMQLKNLSQTMPQINPLVPSVL
jgi:hypothetical protein